MLKAKILNIITTWVTSSSSNPSSNLGEHLLRFVTWLPKSKGFKEVYVVVDRLSKYAHFILLKHLYTTSKVAEVFTKGIMCLHGIPQSIVRDRDPLFVIYFGRSCLYCREWF